jgi:putative PIN family toxin of toxin-antitoxin system
MRVMVDTNVLISAAYNPNGTPFAAYCKAATAPNTLVLSDYIVDEVLRIFAKKFPHKENSIRWLFSLARYELVVTPVLEEADEALIRDVKDRPILRAAIYAGVDVLITGDKDFLESGVGVPKIMTAQQFVSA